MALRRLTPFVIAIFILVGLVLFNFERLNARDADDKRRLNDDAHGRSQVDQRHHPISDIQTPKQECPSHPPCPLSTCPPTSTCPPVSAPGTCAPCTAAPAAPVTAAPAPPGAASFEAISPERREVVKLMYSSVGYSDEHKSALSRARRAREEKRMEKSRALRAKGDHRTRTADQPVKIMFWHDAMYWPHLNFFSNDAWVQGCDVPCKVFPGGKNADNVKTMNPDVVLFMAEEMRDVGHIRSAMAEHQVLAYIVSEAQLFPLHFVETIAKETDVLVSFSETSEVLMNYAYGLLHALGNRKDEQFANDIEGGLAAAGVWKTPAPELPKVQYNETAVFIISNCGPQFRTKYLQELMKLMPVSSLGPCLSQPRHGESAGHGAGGKREAVARYKFVLSFENTIQDGYMTEKFFELATYNTVGVYLGPTDASRFFPGPPGYTSFVDAARFPDPKDLAAYLTSMDAATWKAHFRWREEGKLNPQFRQLYDGNLVRGGKDGWICRLCKFYGEHYDFGPALGNATSVR